MSDWFPALFDRLVEKFGSQQKLGEAARVSQTAVAEWKRTGSIPARRLAFILANAKENGIDLDVSEFVPLLSNDVPPTNEEAAA